MYQNATEDRDRLIADRLTEMTNLAGLAPVMAISEARSATSDG